MERCLCATSATLKMCWTGSNRSRCLLLRYGSGFWRPGMSGGLHPAAVLLVSSVLQLPTLSSAPSPFPPLSTLTHPHTTLSPTRQNMRCDKTPANYQVVRRLQSLLYPRAAEPSEDEQARGVRISAELEAFTARLARRRRRHPGTAPEQGLLLRFEGWAQEEARVEGVGAGLLEDDSDGWVVEEESDGEDSGQPAYRWHAREAAGTQQRQQRWQQRQQQPEGRRRQQQPEPQGGQRGAAAIAAAAADFQHRRQQEQEQQEKEKDRQAQLQQQEQEQQKQQQRATERFPDPDFLRLALQSPRAAHRRITWRTVMVFDRLVGTCPVSYGSRAGGTKLCLQGRTCSDVRQRPLIGNGTYRVRGGHGQRGSKRGGGQRQRQRQHRHARLLLELTFPPSPATPPIPSHPSHHTPSYPPIVDICFTQGDGQSYTALPTNCCMLNPSHPAPPSRPPDRWTFSLDRATAASRGGRPTLLHRARPLWWTCLPTPSRRGTFPTTPETRPSACSRWPGQTSPKPA